MVGMTRPKKYAAGTSSVDDDYNRNRSSISLEELQNSSPLGLVNPYTTLNSIPSFVPPRLDTTEDTTFAPGFYELGLAANDVNNPNSAAAREQASYDASQSEQKLRDRMELQDSLRRDLAPVNPRKRYGLGHSLKTGTEKVPGKGSGKVDTVPATLAPGEAVLNKAAAEHLGRGFIKMLNHMGMMKMGMVEPDEEGHYACGTEEVMKKGKK